MIDLPDVTLLCADTANHTLALRALRHSMAQIRFARVAWLTDAVPAALEVPGDIDVVRIAPLSSRDDYSQLMLKSLLPHVSTPHLLVVQWDGYVANPDAWDPSFLGCDYLGAKWFWHTDGMNVGNGGFSLRSRKLLAALADPRIQGSEAEDDVICRTFRPLLEREYGIRFGDESTADRFSFEAMHRIGRPFGFHGLYNFAQVMPQDELALLAPQFSDDIARSPQCLSLVRNARALGQWQAVDALAARMLAAMPGNAELLALQAEAGNSSRRYAGVSRNDRCPCGSGKRFKQCHGATPAGPPPASAADAVRRGLAAHRGGDLDTAGRSYEEALGIDAGDVHAAHYLGVIHYQRGRFDDALPLVEQSLSRLPQEAEFHNNAGLLYTAMDRIDDAVAAFRNALERKPAHAGAWNNLGLALTQRNDIAGAIDAYRHALDVDPHFNEARFNLALALLTCGDYVEGWRDYDARLAVPALSGDAPMVPGERYRGEALEGRTLLLTTEQGFGDTFQFIRFAQGFAARGARVIVRASPLVATLCASAPGVERVVSNAEALPSYDFQLPLLSSADALSIGAETIATDIPYLLADEERVASLRPIVAAQRARLRIGLSWAGNPLQANNRRRSIPLAALAPLFEFGDIAFFSLQHIDGEEQIPEVPAARALLLPAARHNFDDKAALMRSFDLVISVDTSTAHLAGALGVPLWVLVCHAPDWRWGLDGPVTPWYPAARLFRQQVPNDWSAPVASIVQALRERLSQ